MRIEQSFAHNMELVGYHDLNSKPAFKIAMHVVNDRYYLYLGSYWDFGWSVLDVTEPANPQLVNFVEGPSNVETHQISAADGIMITPMQNLMPFRGSERGPEEGFYIWDIKDPVNPKKLGHWKSGTYLGAHRCYYDGGRYVHAVAGAPGFDSRIYRIVDIADPANPVEVGRWWVPEQFAHGRIQTEQERASGSAPYKHQFDFDYDYCLHEVNIKGDRAYVAAFNKGFFGILDISDVTAPKLISKMEVSPAFGNLIAGHTALPLTKRDLMLISTEGVAQGSLELVGIVDISDEWSPKIISTFPVPETPPGYPYKDFRSAGGPFGPHNFHHSFGGQPYLDDRNDRVYLSYQNAGVRVYDISDEYMPKEIAYYIPEDPTTRLGPIPKGKLTTAVEDVLVDHRGYIYISDFNRGIKILRCTV